MKTWKLFGRKKPYTEIGITRCLCFRCGQPAQYQWNICSDEGKYRPICLKCDVALNRLVLQFIGFPDWMQKLTAYIWSKVE